jgi:hypothetical protein
MARIPHTIQPAADPAAALERNRAEDARLMLRINAAAEKLHRLWSMSSAEEPAVLADRRLSAAILQAEIDHLYARHRQLAAERTMMEELQSVAPRRSVVWDSPYPATGPA